MPATSSTSPPTTDAGMPAPGLRSVITYLLFIHFFFLLVGIKSRTDSSGLEQDLRAKVPGLRPYLQLLGMDLSYMFHLTYYNNMPEAGPVDLSDTDYFLEADIPLPDGTTKTVVLPSSEELSGTRFRRMERLVHAAGVDGEQQSDSAAIVAQGIARRLIQEHKCVEQAKVTPLKLRFRRRLLPNWMLPAEELVRTGALKVERDAPVNFETVYEVLAVLAGDDVQVTRVGAASNSAAPSAAVPSAVPSAAPTGTGARP
ncbi:MAG: hypothetical protein JNK76_11120 [Planctomycetales bacterium]|nr:hypothetical protein [Planctomycetales bacterium]